MFEKIPKINQVLEQYFQKNPEAGKVLAKDLMPYFIKAGIFEKDHRNGLPIRNILRSLDETNQLSLIPYVLAERKPKNTSWYFIPSGGGVSSGNSNASITKAVKTAGGKKQESDEYYVITLCNKVLGSSALRQHKFDFLLGDPGKDGARRKLPVDAYYKERNLVIEYHERQHSEPVPHFDKPDRMTVSGVSRGEQRRLYDQRRKEVLGEKGISVVFIDYTLFNYDSQKRIIRQPKQDLDRIKTFLVSSGILNTDDEL